MGKSSLWVLSLLLLNSLLSCGHAEEFYAKATLTEAATFIPPGQSVTLSCSVDGSDGWKFDWFRQVTIYDEAEVIKHEDPDGIISISEGGLYSCGGVRGDFSTHISDKVNITRAYKTEGSSFLILPLTGLFIGILLIIALILVYCYKTSKESRWVRFRNNNLGSAADQRVIQNETDLHVYSSLQYGDACVYETIRGSEDVRNGGPGSLYQNNTFALTPNQPQTLDRIKKHEDPAASSDYNNISQEPATATNTV